MHVGGCDAPHARDERRHRARAHEAADAAKDAERAHRVCRVGRLRARQLPPRVLEPAISTMVVQVLLGDEETMMQFTALPDAHTLVRGTNTACVMRKHRKYNRDTTQAHDRPAQPSLPAPLARRRRKLGRALPAVPRPQRRAQEPHALEVELCADISAPAHPHPQADAPIGTGTARCRTRPSPQSSSAGRSSRYRRPRRPRRPRPPRRRPRPRRPRPARPRRCRGGRATRRARRATRRARARRSRRRAQARRA
jgi:hypothetical protein